MQIFAQIKISLKFEMKKNILGRKNLKEANSHDQSSMTKRHFEYDQKYITTIVTCLSYN